MKKKQAKDLFLSIFTISVLCIYLSACKKEDDSKQIELDANTKQFNDDANKFKNESDEISDNINSYIKDVPAFGRVANGSNSFPICGVTVDSSLLSQKILIFNFDGITPCSSPSRTRSGQIKVQLTSGLHWSDSLSVLTETFINYKVTRLSDNKSITINGVKKITNINGNNWIGFFTGLKNLKYKVRAYNVQVLYDNAQTAVWNLAHTAEYNYMPASQKITFSCNGDTAFSGLNGISSWGTNRNTQNFTTHFTTPWVSNSYCGYWRPISGEFTHSINNANFTITLGVDQGGNASTLNCAYGYKVVWSTANGSGSAIISY